ncbi:ascus development protein 3 [Metarhizium acridum CQMa 102]|uniref:Ascus development protein 3 n=1 Tax=Metarhizium acridum (strain CQMa 102) TaxID=655827 RepID=E9DVA4_METAQ|nr:ascus development protein 3 [Metarhizium acridum CQMa 102]EFY92281.1 ascus development protein 3 [Metarhizium acridum CQMa 102]
MRRLSALPRGTRRLYGICLHLAIGASIWGYNIGILSSVLVHPGWREALGEPTPAQRGLITGIYYLGTFLSYTLLSHPLADYLGRRQAAAIGTGALCLGAACMAAANGGAAVGAMALGRWLCGVGVGVVSATVPLYQSEVSPAKERGRPRWLLEKGDVDTASKVLHYLREEAVAAEAITHELHAISADVESRHKAGATFVSLSLSLFRDASLFARLWRAFLLQFMAQMCGATAIKYYLPTLLKALGLEYRLALVAGAAEMTIKIAMTIVEMWAIDWFGRRTCLTGGSLIMGVAMLSWPRPCRMGIQLRVRARGLNFAASGGSIGSILVSQIWPVGNARFGSGIYFFFMVVNFICVPVIWLLYPETKGRELEDMDSLFGKSEDRNATLPLDGVAEDAGEDGDMLITTTTHEEDEPLLS